MSRDTNWKAQRTVALGERLRDLREDHDLHQKDLASMLHIDRSTYAYYELGRARPDYEALILLAELYHVSLEYLLGQ